MNTLIRFILFIRSKFLNKEYKLSFLWIILAKIQNLHIPDNTTPLFNFSYSVLLFSFVALISFISLFNTILVLQLKDKFDLEAKFKDYPLILKLINYYKRASFYNILIESIIVFIAIIILFIASLLMVLKIISENS
jgi:hypothetical protein